MNTQSNDHIAANETAGTPTWESRRQRRFAALGVTAGLLGGGAIGLLTAAPSLSSAAGVATTITDDTITGDTATGDTATGETGRPDPSVRLRESLQTLVDDGTITTAQADAVATHLASLRGEMRGEMGGVPGGHRGHRGGGVDTEVLATALGIEAAEIRTALQAGSTIAELAEASGVDVQTVIDALVAAANERIDLAVADGKLTEDEAATKRAELTERITELVDTEITFGRRGPRAGESDGGMDAPAATEATS